MLWVPAAPAIILPKPDDIQRNWKALAPFPAGFIGKAARVAATPTYRASGVTTDLSGSPQTVALPASPVNGELMILFASAYTFPAAGVIPTINTPSGWTSVGTAISNGDGGSNEITLAAFYRFYQTGDSAPSVSFTSANNQEFTAVINAYTGATAIESYTTGTQTTTNPSLLSFTTLGANRLVIQAMTGCNNTVVNNSQTVSAGWTFRLSPVGSRSTTWEAEQPFTASGSSVSGTTASGTSSLFYAKLALALYG